jgi:hypothetical protein
MARKKQQVPIRIYVLDKDNHIEYSCEWCGHSLTEEEVYIVCFEWGRPPVLCVECVFPYKLLYQLTDDSITSLPGNIL